MILRRVQWVKLLGPDPVYMYLFPNVFQMIELLTLKAPITTAADDTFLTFFLTFEKKI